MAITLRKRATISTEFIDELIAIYKGKLEELKQSVDRAPKGLRSQLIKDNGLKIRRLMSLVNDKSCFDQELTKLRSLNYSAFDVVTHADKRFLYGKTNEITLDYRVKYSMGEYGIYIPISKLYGRQSGGTGIESGAWHFIPFKSPKICARTPHHKAYPDDVHPLERASQTCWGTFGQVVPSLLSDGDITELFRALHLYVTRYDEHSPLVRFYDLTFAKELP